MKVNYEEYSDYTSPCLTLNNDNKHYELGVFANRHRRYLKKHHRIIYYNLLTSNKLYDYLSNIEIEASNYYESLIKSLAQKENIDEDLKTDDMMLWAQKMNNIQNIAREMVNQEIIYRY